MDANTSIYSAKKIRHVVKKDIKLPDVIVLTMNFHGIIEMEMPDLITASKLREPIRLSDILIPKHIGTIPAGITLVKMNAVALGVSNFLSPPEIRQEIDMIITELSNPKFENIANGTEKNVEVCKNFSEVVAQNMKQQIFRNITGNVDTTRLTRDNIETYIRLPKGDLPSNAEQRYAYFDQLMTDFSYTTKIYRPGDLYTDKTFTRECLKAKQFDAQVSGDLQCKVINMRGQMDIIDFLFPDLKVSQGSLIVDDHTLYLSSIIDGLKAYGVKIIIFFDSTCSVLGNLNSGIHLGRDYPANQNIYTIEDLKHHLLTTNPKNFPGGSFKKMSKKQKYNKKNTFKNRISRKSFYKI
jgi:hypothetical protein